MICPDVWSTKARSRQLPGRLMSFLRIVVILSLAALLAAQPTGGSLHGVLTDNSGAVIPSATVSITGVSGQRNAVSRVDGSYSFAGLVAGDYTVKVSYPGFGTIERTVTISDGKTVDLPIQLL